MALVAAFPFLASTIGSAAPRTMDLYVNLFGWSTEPGQEDDPGPGLVVTEGDEVTITLHSTDGLDHGLVIEYPDEPFVSPITSSTVTFTHIADIPGVFPYYDLVLPYNDGVWTTTPINSPPDAVFVAPTAGTSWTGGSSHAIQFDLIDDGPPTGLTVWVNYSYGGVQRGTIAGPIQGRPNTNTVSWTPTPFDATDAVIHLAIQDSDGLSGLVDSAPFTVDSSPPTIEPSSRPIPDATDVATSSTIRIVWSEPMREESGLPASFGVLRVGGGWVEGDVTWSADRTAMTLRPTAPLSVATSYDVYVNTSATDASDPGNAFAGVVRRFSTSSTPDSTPPSVQAVTASPNVQIAGSRVNVTAEVQDDGGVASVSAQVDGPAFSENLTMTQASDTMWFVDRSYESVGHYDVVVWATDTAGHAASQTTGFDIVPEGSIVPLTPSSLSAAVSDGTVEVTWNPVSYPGHAGYLVYRGEAPTGPFDRLTISPWTETAYRDGSVEGSRTYYYTVTSVNTTGAESPFAAAYKVTIPPYQTPPIFNPVPWAIAGVTLGAILGAIYGTIRRKRLA